MRRRNFAFGEFGFLAEPVAVVGVVRLLVDDFNRDFAAGLGDTLRRGLVHGARGDRGTRNGVDLGALRRHEGLLERFGRRLTDRGRFVRNVEHDVRDAVGVERHRHDDVARASRGADRVRDALDGNDRGLRATRRFKRRRKVRAVRTFDRGFARGIDVGKDDPVDGFEYLDEILEAVARARVAVRLEGHNQAAARPGAAQRRNRRRHFVRMVTVVVDEREGARFAVGARAGDFAVLREAAADTREFREPLGDRFARDARKRRNGDGRKGVPHVMEPRQIQNDGQRRMVGAQHREVHARADRLHVDRAHESVRRKAVADHGLRDAVADRTDVFVVHAKDRDPVEGEAFEEVDEGRLEVLEVVPVGVHVVFVDVRHDGDDGRQIEERRVRLVRFRDEEFARAEARVRARAVELPADDERGVEPALREKGCGERRRRRLPVGARNGDPAAKTHEFGKHHGARHDGDAEFARRDHFGVVRFHGRGNDDGVRPSDVLLVVALIDAGAETLQAFGDGRACEVRAAHDVAEVEHHFGDAAHARAADTDEMQMIDQKLHGCSFFG